MGEHPVGQLVHRRRAARAGRVPVRAEHDVLDDQLRLIAEQVAQAGLTVRALEHVLLVDPDHRQPAPFRVERVPLAGLLLLRRQQLPPGLQPLRPRHDLGKTHRCLQAQRSK